MSDGDLAITRLTVSRETLYRYRTMPGGTGDDLEWLLKQIGSELTILQGIAEGTLQDREAIDLLMEAWQDFANQLKRRAH